VARLAGRADIAEGLLDRSLVAALGDAGQLVGRGVELLADAPGFVEVLEELRLQAGLVAQLLGGGVGAEQRAHARVGDGGDDIGGRGDLGLVERLLAVDDLGLDLAHVPGHELVARLAGFDHLFRLHLRLDGGACQQRCGSAQHQCFHVHSSDSGGWRPRPPGGQTIPLRLPA